MEILGHEVPEDAFEWHKTYLINGEELYLLMEIEGMFARTGKHDLSTLMNKLIKSALEHELEEEEE